MAAIGYLAPHFNTPASRAFLRSDEGKALLRAVLRESMQLAAARAADRLPEGGVGWRLARLLAGLPVSQ